MNNSNQSKVRITNTPKFMEQIIERVKKNYGTTTKGKETVQKDDDGKSLPIVNFLLKLKNPVREDIYNYITSVNSAEAEEITSWIKDVRVQLKKNVIRKHNREINNKEIYSYMHDVFGMEFLNIFDMQNGDFYIGIADDKISDGHTKKSSEEEAADLSKVDLEEVDLDAVSKETKESEETEAEDSTDESE